MRVLLTGANGQFGTEYQAYTTQVAPHDQLTALGHADLDVTNRDMTLQVLGAVRPDVVVHAGAWTNVDGCDVDPKRALLVNAIGTRNVAEAASLVGSRVVYLSTDYVFDGRGGGANGNLPYTEWDMPNPQSSYGRSKFGGERDLVDILGPAATIVRTSWVVGAHGSNFLKTMLRLAKLQPAVPQSHAGVKTATLTVVDDQWGIPTFTADLVHAVRDIAVRRLPGTFHLSNRSESVPVTWCGFAKAIFAESGEDPERVIPVTTEQYISSRSSITAPRPAYSVLDSAAASAMGIEMPDWRGSLRRAVAELQPPAE
jgi:dTDP-4-dehydrorhamnose reductase